MSAAVLGVLADASLRAAVVAALVAAAVAALRVRAGAARHAAWTVVLAAMLLMPALARLVPAVDVPVMPALARFLPAIDVQTMPALLRLGPAVDVAVPQAARGGTATLAEEPPPQNGRAPATPQDGRAPATPQDGRAPATPQDGRAPATPASASGAPPRQDGGASRGRVPPVPSRGPWSWALVAFRVYLAGVAAMLLRLALGLWGSRRLVLGARRLDGSTRRRLGTLPARVRESDRIAVPVTVGLFRSTVVLPTGWERWPDAKLRAVLAHEQAHIERRDPLVAGLASLNRCLFWFHPLAWWLPRALALTAEQACDEAAVRTVGAPQAYIELLRSMAAAVRARGGRYLWEGVGMHGSPSLTRRVKHIQRLAPGRAVSPPSGAAPTRQSSPDGSARHPTSPAGVRAVLRCRLLAAACGLIAVAVAACRPVVDVTGDPLLDIQRQVDTATVASWPVERLIDDFPDTEVAVAQRDRPRAEEILLERRTEDPTGPWSARLGRFYAASATGYRVRITDGGPFVEVTEFDPDSAFAAHARVRLTGSNDPVLLAAAAEYVLNAPRYNPNSFPEDVLLARGCLERAARLDPESERTRTMLADLVASERSRAAWLRDRRVAPVEQYAALAALPAAERFEAMAQAAVGALTAVRGAARFDDRNLDGYIAVKTDNAGRFAREVLALAPRFMETPDAGLFIYQAHMALSSLATLEGDIDAAVDALRRAAAAPPAEGLTYGHRVAAWRVLLDLAEAGERTAVVDFLEAMAERNLADRDRLLATAADVRDGQPPLRLFRRADPAGRL